MGMIAISDSPPQYGVLALRDIVSGLVLLRGTLLCAGYGSPAGALLVCVYGVLYYLKESPVGGWLAQGVGPPVPTSVILFLSWVVACFVWGGAGGIGRF